jgi:hypothetical protein
MRRWVGAPAVLAGLVLIGFTFSHRLFERADDAETVSDQYRGLMSAAGLAELRDGFESVKAAGAELSSRAEPRLQEALGLDDEQFQRHLDDHLPGIATFDARAGGIVTVVEPVIGQMEAARPDYERADDIPTGFLPLSSAPWLFLGVGALLVATGGWAAWRPGGRSAMAVVVVGLGVAIVPLALQIPAKVDAAVRVSELGATGLDPATGQAAVGATAVFDGLADDVTGGLKPALTAAEGLSGPRADAWFAATFPALDRFTADWQGGISAKSHDLADSQVALAPVFADAHRIPLRPVPAMFIGWGFVSAAVGGLALALGRRRRPATQPSGDDATPPRPVALAASR